jgi:para-nitrobenzyl esterase
MGAREPVVLDTPLGRIAGSAVGAVTRFLCVPYAAPPVGPLRLRSPGAAAAWTGVRDVRSPAPASLQTLGGNQVWLNEPIANQSEDCLYLNIWTPDASGCHPVIVWLHGGQTRNGHGAAPGIDGSALAALGLVVVTINYRLGALGGLAHPALEDDATGQCANWGLQDQLAALGWVARSIACFGGDPTNVTLAGQSSGGANVAMIAQHRLADGRYARVICQSPPLFRPPMYVDLDAAAAYTEAFAANVGVCVRDLRDIDGVALQRAEHAFANSPELAAAMGRPRTAPVRDGRLLREWPCDAPAGRVPVLAGWTRDEANFWFDLHDGEGRVISPLQPPRSPEELQQRVAGLVKLSYAFDSPPSADSVIAAYAASGEAAAAWRDVYTDAVFRAPILHFVGKHARAGVPARAYEFAYPLPSPGNGSPHAADVPFVFGTWMHPHLACKIGRAPAVAAVSAAMMRAWAAFARTGDPTDAAGEAWPVFDPADPCAMRFGPDRAHLVALDRSAGLACWPAYRA